MFPKNILAVLALATVMVTNLFGLCSIQHIPVHGHAMPHGIMLTSGYDDGTCPLTPVADFQVNEKFSQADSRTFGQAVPAVSNAAILVKILHVDEGIGPNHDPESLSVKELPLTITSPPLAYALSQGILNPKTDSAIA